MLKSRRTVWNEEGSPTRWNSQTPLYIRNRLNSSRADTAYIHAPTDPDRKIVLLKHNDQLEPLPRTNRSSRLDPPMRDPSNIFFVPETEVVRKTKPNIVNESKELNTESDSQPGRLDVTKPMMFIRPSENETRSRPKSRRANKIDSNVPNVSNSTRARLNEQISTRTFHFPLIGGSQNQTEEVKSVRKMSAAARRAVRTPSSPVKTETEKPVEGLSVPLTVKSNNSPTKVSPVSKVRINRTINVRLSNLQTKSNDVFPDDIRSRDGSNDRLSTTRAMSLPRINIDDAASNFGFRSTYSTPAVIRQKPNRSTSLESRFRRIQRPINEQQLTPRKPSTPRFKSEEPIVAPALSDVSSNESRLGDSGIEETETQASEKYVIADDQHDGEREIFEAAQKAVEEAMLEIKAHDQNNDVTKEQIKGQSNTGRRPLDIKCFKMDPPGRQAGKQNRKSARRSACQQSIVQVFKIDL